MAEQLTLTTPQTIPAKLTDAYRVVFVGLYVEQRIVVVQVRGTNGEIREARAEGPEAQAILVALNTSNNTVKSLQRRVLEWVAAKLADLAGTVTGTPD